MYLCIYIATHLHTVYLQCLQTVLDRNSKYAWKWRSSDFRPWTSKYGDAIGDRDRINSEIQWEAVIARVWWCTCRLTSSELRDALWGCDRASLEIQLKTRIQCTQRDTWRPWSSEFGDALSSHDGVSFNMQLEGEILWTQRYTPR